MKIQRLGLRPQPIEPIMIGDTIAMHRKEFNDIIIRRVFNALEDEVGGVEMHGSIGVNDFMGAKGFVVTSTEKFIELYNKEIREFIYCQADNVTLSTCRQILTETTHWSFD